MTIIRVIDFETTGSEPPEAEVCEVGLCDLHLEERAIDAPISWLCGVGTMPPEVRAIHHISHADCAGKNIFNPALMPGEASAFAAHNAEFECKFFTPTLPVICTYKAALRAWRMRPATATARSATGLRIKG